MSWSDCQVLWPGEPVQCQCARTVVASIEETLDCPRGWKWVPGTGWVHSWPRPMRRAQLSETAQAAS
jgi:hypothetical protein